MPKKNSHYDKPPFRLKSEIEFFYKSYFLHYINKEAENIAIAIKELTPQCLELFGKFPVSINTIKDTNNLGVWFHIPSDFDESSERWIEIIGIFNDCIWRDSRDIGSFHWFDFLRKSDHILDQILEIEETLTKNIKQNLESLNEEKLNSLREAFSGDFTMPKEKISILDLQFSLSRHTSNWLYENDKNYSTLINLKNSKLRLLRKFQIDFDFLLKQFFLEKRWIANSVFIAIWNGTGKLQMDSVFEERIASEIITEIKTKFAEKRKSLSPQDDAEFFLNDNNIPLPDPFVYKDDYWIYFNFEDYENAAVVAFRQHLQDYFGVIEQTLKKHGYKKTSGNTHNYKRMEWLVLWNNSNYKYLWEIISKTDEFKNVNMKNKRQVNSIEGRIQKEFAKFKLLGFLPMKPYGNNRKK